MKIKKEVLTAIIFFLIGVVAMYFYSQTTNLTSVQNKALTNPPNPSSLPCKIDNGTLEASIQTESEIAKRVFNNRPALKLIKDRCMWVFGAVKGDLLSSGEENIVFWGSEAGCGSCHGQIVYVLSGNRVILEKGVSDPKVEIIKDDKGKDVLSIIEPLRREDEGLMYPSWGVRTLYRWSKGSTSFYAFDSRPFKY